MRPVGERLRVGDDLPLVGAELGRRAPRANATALAAMTCISGPPWLPGKTERVERLRVRLAAEDQAAARAAQRLVRRRGDELAVRDRRRMEPAATSPAKCAMSAMSMRADLVGDGAERREVDLRADRPSARRRSSSGARSRARCAHLVEVDAGRRSRARRRARPGRTCPEKLTGLPCVRCPPCDRFIARIVSPGFELREVDGHVGLRARVRLHVGAPRRRRAPSRARSRASRPRRRTRSRRSSACPG